MTDDPYARLGLTRQASPEQIRRAYRRRAKALHPDAGGSAAEMARLSAAYAALRAPAPGPIAGPRPVVRAPRSGRRLRAPAIAWSAAAEAFTLAVLLPQARLLALALDRLETEVDATLATPSDPARAATAREVAGQTTAALAMGGARLARSTWPDDLAVARGLWGEALRDLSDALLDLRDAPDPAALAEARQGLARGRSRLHAAEAALPGRA